MEFVTLTPQTASLRVSRMKLGPFFNGPATIHSKPTNTATQRSMSTRVDRLSKSPTTPEQFFQSQQQQRHNNERSEKDARACITNARLSFGSAMAAVKPQSIAKTKARRRSYEYSPDKRRHLISPV
jgi:hypothetical protein